jgi:hypothetical protein
MSELILCAFCKTRAEAFAQHWPHEDRAAVEAHLYRQCCVWRERRRPQWP